MAASTILLTDDERKYLKSLTKTSTIQAQVVDRKNRTLVHVKI